MNLLLTIELIPSSSFYSNVRSNVSTTEWNKIRKQCYAKANHRCEICNGVGHKWPVECHEVWHYDEVSKVQKLVGMVALCPNCHMVKHFGLAQIQGKEELAIKHLMSINKISRACALQHISDSFKKWVEYSKYDWILDITYLESYK